jgi:hypothetical protein
VITWSVSGDGREAPLGCDEQGVDVVGPLLRGKEHAPSQAALTVPTVSLRSSLTVHWSSQIARSGLSAG